MTIPSPIEITRRLITMPSVNPPGDELAAQNYLHTLLEKAGFQVQVLEKVPGRPNLVTRLPGRGRGWLP